MLQSRSPVPGNSKRKHRRHDSQGSAPWQQIAQGRRSRLLGLEESSMNKAWLNVAIRDLAKRKDMNAPRKPAEQLKLEFREHLKKKSVREVSLAKPQERGK